MLQRLAIAPAATPRWRLTTPPEEGASAVTLAEMKMFLNRAIEDTFWDDEIETFIAVASKAVEKYCDLVLLESTWSASLPMLAPQARLVRRPFVSLESLEYVASDGTVTTMPSELYHCIETNQMTGTLYLAQGQEWPTMAHRQDAVRLSVIAGYDPADIDPDLKLAIMMTVAAIDQQRGDSTNTGGSNVTVYAMKQSRGAGMIPPEAVALLAPYKYRSIVAA